ncbi:GGDEF domain-containing protein [Halanaerobacter jeridensis]|uniref:Diguanylate cyclase (GGDEF)-like protein n=1 Tax=Halanaerobacter jeridensis TaxID=706427 RepID=A0A939BNH5_9FIRM|nr:GGDEF domain-containing protein [Halanaerobacter jeridensis]MBM7555502.1 diguanylate cyclase (GGDEF)-like protein [Halanaerobacter jeridensis]
MVILTDITEKKKIEKRALRDGLTELYNHSYFQKRLSREIDKMKEYDYRHYLSLLMLDIDDFKQFNDTYGHQAGDEVLRSVARVLKQEFVDESEIVARYGGEEFAIILPEVTKVGLKIKGKEVNELIRSLAVNYNDLELQITVSIGGATYKNSESKEEFIKRADDALYQAKAEGKDTFHFSD